MRAPARCRPAPAAPPAGSPSARRTARGLPLRRPAVPLRGRCFRLGERKLADPARPEGDRDSGAELGRVPVRKHCVRVALAGGL